MPRVFSAFAILVVALALGGCSSDTPTGTCHVGTCVTDAGSDGGSANHDADTDGLHPTYPDPYALTPFDNVRIASHEDQPNFQGADAAIDFHDGPFRSVIMTVDLESPCFPWTKWQATPPPAGQNWPADCDAFDRNFEFSLDDPKEPSDKPGLELVRAITPFGGPLHYDVDLTDIANGLPGSHNLHVLISTWSDGAGLVSGTNGSWFVSAKIVATPGPAPREVLAVQPLYYASQTDPTPPVLPAIVVPEGTSSSRVEYRVTGHGGVQFASGCSVTGPAEEFCQREHNVILDDQLLADVLPWRNDCYTLADLTPGSPFGDYCAKNPCGAVQSVRAERANWCPGSVTPPIVWEDAPALSVPGNHKLSWHIADIAVGGSWRVSATYFAFKTAPTP